MISIAPMWCSRMSRPRMRDAPCSRRRSAALLLVRSLTEKHLVVREEPVSRGCELIPGRDTRRSAVPIADAKGPYESFDIPKGTFCGGAPPVPDADVTTLKVGYYLVATTPQLQRGRRPRPQVMECPP